jgi:hypothetical protein
VNSSSEKENASPIWLMSGATVALIRIHTLFDARLLFDAPMAILVADCILELVRI